MGKIFPKTNEAVLEFVLEWVDLLAAREIEKALKLIRNRERPRKLYGFQKFQAMLGLKEKPAPFIYTPDWISKAISGYGNVDEPKDFWVTDPTSPTGNSARKALENEAARNDDDETESFVHPLYPIAVYWYRDASDEVGEYLGFVHLDYPLNGKWSDLSSVFDIYAVDGGVTLELERIEVM